jgi:hypothetical protein
MIRQDAGRGALPRDRRRTSEHGEQGHLPGNAPSPDRFRMQDCLDETEVARVLAELLTDHAGEPGTEGI